MMQKYLRVFNSKQRGQAMTEMLVASAFVVVPLFLIIPTFGKYVDMKHAAVSSARYSAWERTVSFNDATLANQPSNFVERTAFKQTDFNMKSDAQIAAEAQLRIFTGADVAINGTSPILGRSLWAYHDGSPMYTATVKTGEAPPVEVVSNQLTPDKTPLDSASNIINVVADVFAFVSDIFPDSFSSNPSVFDAVTMRGLTKIEIEMSVLESPRYATTIGDNTRPRTPLIELGSDFKMRAKAGVLSQTWSAGGGSHLESQAQGLVFTKLIGDIFNTISIPGIGSGQDIIAAALLTPEFSAKNLVFGQMDNEVLPRDKLSGWKPTDAAYDSANPLCNDKGYCRE
jgi:hypothetical protein